MRHAGGVPVLALPSRFGVDPISPCPPWSRQPSERRAPKGTISALGGTLSTPLNATMSVGRHLVQLRAENWPRLVLTVTSLGPCSPGTTGLSLMIAWLCASRSKIPPSRYPLKAYENAAPHRPTFPGCVLSLVVPQKGCRLQGGRTMVLVWRR